jgi:hypothetical protein
MHVKCAPEYENILIDNRMAPIPTNRIPLRRSTRFSSPAEESIVVNTIPQASRQAVKSTTPSRTPETRKRKIDFQSLHNYDFQGSPPSTPKPSKSVAPIAKKARLSAAEKTQSSVKKSQSQVTIDEEISENEKDLNQEKKKNGAGKRAW